MLSGIAIIIALPTTIGGDYGVYAVILRLSFVGRLVLYTSVSTTATKLDEYYLELNISPGFNHDLACSQRCTASLEDPDYQ